VVAPPGSRFTVLAHPGGGGDGPRLPNGDHGLPVSTQGACVLTLKETGSPGGAIDARAKKHRGKPKGLIKPARLVVESAGRHYIPLTPTRKQIKLWKKQHKHRGHHGALASAAAAGDPVKVNCQPISFSPPPGPPPAPIFRNSTNVNPAPPPGFTVILGGLDLDGFCRSIGFAHSQLNTPVIAPNAALAWACVSFAGQQQPIDFAAACQHQYPGLNAVMVANLGNGYSGQCWARGTPTGGSGTTTTVNVPPPPPPSPPLHGCWNAPGNGGSRLQVQLSICVSNNQVTSISTSFQSPEPSGKTCFGRANLPHPIPLNPGGFFNFASFPPQTNITGGFSFAGQLLATGGTAGIRVGLCDGINVGRLLPP
jgi:hypothetical protein